jgi:archaeal type IV pilus assembly protein PilA
MYKREEAVSPVIGVILMVAITVILAAVIAAFVFGMAGNVNKTKTVAFTAERAQNSNTGLLVMAQGGKDSNQLLSTTVQVGQYVASTNEPQGGPTTIGTYTRHDLKTTNIVKIVVTATFKDNSKQVVIDTSV